MSIISIFALFKFVQFCNDYMNVNTPATEEQTPSAVPTTPPTVIFC